MSMPTATQATDSTPPTPPTIMHLTPAFEHTVRRWDPPTSSSSSDLDELCRLEIAITGLRAADSRFEGGGHAA
jgi:hypothetical protein